MKHLNFIAVLCCLTMVANAQNVGIGTPTPNPRAILDLSSANKGFLLPRVLLTGATDNTTIPNAPYGLMVINQSELEGEGAGVYIQTGTPVAPNWRRLGLASGGWALQGNSGATGSVLGHLESRPLQFIVGGSHVARLGGNSNILLGLNSGTALPQTTDFNSYNNIAMGNNAMAIATTGTSNIAIGNNAMNQANGGSTGIAIGGSALNKQSAGALENIAIGFSSQAATTSGSYNISFGRQSLFRNTTGSNNVAHGAFSLEENTTGSTNVAVGNSAATKNTTGYSNVAIGASALFSNTTKSNLVAIGDSALYHNGIGATLFHQAIDNTAIGAKALFSNTLGDKNTAIGKFALKDNTEGSFNTAIGANTMLHNTIGNFNTATGFEALLFNTEGKENTATGFQVLSFNSQGSGNTANGYDAMSFNLTGSGNTAIGTSALYKNTNGNFNTSIGYASLFENRTANRNSSFGYQAMGRNNSGNNNVSIGDSTLFANISGSGNIALGHYAAASETGSDKLYIENSNGNKDNALIYGDFAADSLLLNAKTINKFSLNVRASNALEMGYGAAGKQTDAGKVCYGCFGDPAHWLGIVGGGTAELGNDRVIKLWSEGGLRIKGNALPNTDNGHSLGQSGLRWSSVWAVNGTINTSDANLKTNIATSPYGLDEVMQMNPVQYNWKTNPTEDLQIGFLAQDIQKIIPEAVVVPANGDPLGMKYTELIPVLVKAIQELKKEVTELKKQLNK